ncbi:unnamed protein product [Gadus morhua 'NCC']
MDEEREEGGPTSKTTLSGGYGCHSKAESPKQQERADPPGPKMSDHFKNTLGKFETGGRSMEQPARSEDGNQHTMTRNTHVKRYLEQTAVPPGPSHDSMKSDQSVTQPKFGDGNKSTEQRVQQERADPPGPSCVSMKSDMSMEQPISFQEGNQPTEPSGSRRTHTLF